VYTKVAFLLLHIVRFMVIYLWVLVCSLLAPVPWGQGGGWVGVAKKFSRHKHGLMMMVLLPLEKV
jgi:hypothetical protein